MKTFKQFCEEVDEVTARKMENKVKQLQGRLSTQINKKDIIGADKTVTRAGKITQVLVRGI